MSDAGMRQEGGRPLVSVVIPTHNYGRYVCDAVESVLAQTYAPLEIVVVDDGSTDETPQVLVRFGSRIRSIRLPGRGVAEARNTGLQASSGDLVVFLDADDLLLPDGIAAQVAYFDRHPDVDVVHGEWYRCETDSGTWRLRGNPRLVGDILPRILFGNLAAIHAIMSRRRAILEAGGFDPAFSNAADWEVWLRLAAQGYRFGFIRQPVAIYRIHRDTMSSHLDLDTRDALHVLDKCFQTPALGGRVQTMRESAYFVCWRRHGMAHLARAEEDKALDLFGEALHYAPDALQSVDFYFRMARTIWRGNGKASPKDVDAVTGRTLQFLTRVASCDGDYRATRTAAMHLAVALVLGIARHRRRALAHAATATRVCWRRVFSLPGLQVLVRAALPAYLARTLLGDEWNRSVPPMRDHVPPLVASVLRSGRLSPPAAAAR